MRSKTNHNLVGTISEIEYSVDYWYGEIEKIVITVMVMSEEGCLKYETFNGNDIEKIDEEMTKYEVGDLVKHRLYNKSIIVDISEFKETGYIDIVPLEEMCRGQIKHVSIENLKKIDEFLINTDTYNELVDTIVKLKDENYELKEEIVNSKLRKDINANALYYFGYQLPEVKSVLYHKPATIIFWKDGTKTVVKAQNKEKYDKEKGFVMAYLKKILGNEGNYYEEIKRWTDIQ